MKFFAVGVALALAVASAACTDDDDRTSVAPTSTPAPLETVISPPPVPTPTIPAFPAVGPAVATSGWIVFHRGRDLWAAKLDGSIEVPLVEGALGSHFAGLANVPGIGRVLYFTALTAVDGEEPSIEGETVEIRRKLLEDVSSPVEAVTTIRIPRTQAREFRFMASEASVSPDGQYLAYADDSGLWLRDLVTSAQRRLLTNERSGCDLGPIEQCWGFREPSWSPAGQWLVLTQGLYEGSVADYIRPLEPVTQYTSDIGAQRREWSADGTQVCGPEGRLQIEGWGVVKPGEPIMRDDGATTLAGKYRDLDAELDAAGVQVGGWITDCAWAGDGRIAIQYMHDERGYDQRIAVLAADGSLVAEVDPPLNQSGLVGWLPEQSGFVLTYGDGEGRPLSFIVLLDGSVHALAIETDDVVAVFPE